MVSQESIQDFKLYNLADTNSLGPHSNSSSRRDIQTSTPNVSEYTSVHDNVCYFVWTRSGCIYTVLLQLCPANRHREGDTLAIWVGFPINSLSKRFLTPTQGWTASLWDCASRFFPSSRAALRYLPLPPRPPLPNEPRNRQFHALPLPPVPILHSTKHHHHTPIRSPATPLFYDPTPRYPLHLSTACPSNLHLPPRVALRTSAHPPSLHRRLPPRVGSPTHPHGRIRQLQERIQKHPRIHIIGVANWARNAGVRRARTFHSAFWGHQMDDVQSSHYIVICLRQCLLVCGGHLYRSGMASY